ncbi:hypothetical protein GCM10023257_45420 [Streptomyces hyderabadensis]|uniref:Uncharacterized protein n=2 Tax=Streptomyces hyderabadensis TaxID=598549 RepID=A0ABP9IIX6_9ACTN
MNDPQGIPAAPSDRDLPDHRRTREELLMKIGPQDNGASLRRRWGVPLGVATGVTAVSLAAVVVLGGTGDAGPKTTGPARGGASPAGSAPASAPSAASSPGGASAEAGFTITDATTTPIDARTVTRILSSCLGPDASRYHSVVAVRTPLASADWDGVVVAVDSAGQYVQCQSKGDKGTSQDSPPTFINDRLWGTGRVVEYFDSMMVPAGEGKYLMLGAGHYSSDVARITVSYGDDPKEYPARMAGGAFVYGAALSPDTPPGPRYLGPSPYVHAYDASGKEIYDQAEDPKFTGDE